jgi:HD-like signal output (HDOD) protein/ActR/RegA family two-component response regulator
MKKSILIFDEDKSFCYVMTAIFKRHDFNVITAARMDEAVSTLKNPSIKVIFMSVDLKFREKDGITICRALNKAYKGRIPIIMTSAVATEEKVIRSIQAGALEFILKPPEEKQVLAKTNTAMSVGSSKFIVSDNLKQLNFKEGMSIPDMVQMVIDEADEIRSMPQAVAKIISVSQDDKTGAGAMEKAILSDAAIAAMILKLANSAFYKGKAPIMAVKDAVIRIGFEECRKLVLGLSVFKLFSKDQQNFGFNRGHYWLHCVTTAVFAEGICRKAESKEEADAFMVGLLHDFGKILLDDYLSEHFQKALQICSIKDLKVFEAENEVFERDHAGITKAIMTKWNFPENMGEAVLRHHHIPKQDPDSADAPATLSDVIFLANQMAKASLLGGSGDYFGVNVPRFVWSSFKINDGVFDLEELKGWYKKIKDFLDFLEITEEDLGVKVDLPENVGKACIITNPEDDYQLLSFFLHCQGYEVDIVKGTQAIPEDDCAFIFIYVTDKQTTQERFKELVTANPAAKILLFANKKTTSQTSAPSNITYLDSSLNFHFIKTAMSEKMNATKENEETKESEDTETEKP